MKKCIPYFFDSKIVMDSSMQNLCMKKKFTITAQLWTKWWLSENGCSKNANLTSVQGHVRPHFAASWWKVLGAFFGKTAFSQVIFYSILCQKWMYQAKLKICFGLLNW